MSDALILVFNQVLDKIDKWPEGSEERVVLLGEFVNSIKKIELKHFKAIATFCTSNSRYQFSKKPEDNQGFFASIEVAFREAILNIDVLAAYKKRHIDATATPSDEAITKLFIKNVCPSGGAGLLVCVTQRVTRYPMMIEGIVKIITKIAKAHPDNEKINAIKAEAISTLENLKRSVLHQVNAATKIVQIKELSARVKEKGQFYFEGNQLILRKSSYLNKVASRVRGQVQDTENDLKKSDLAIEHIVDFLTGQLDYVNVLKTHDSHEATKRIEDLLDIINGFNSMPGMRHHVDKYREPIHELHTKMNTVWYDLKGKLQRAYSR
jgi:hypothetical protein